MPERDDVIQRIWSFSGRRWDLGRFPKLMGIVNVTPDSFSDGGQYTEIDSAVKHALELVEQGADILDIGGESTRPGAKPVDEAQELRRVIPVIERLAQQTETPISIDTMKARVAKESLSAGAVIVNDVSAATYDVEMIPVCAENDCGVILMHMRGTPQTMQDEPTYRDVVSEVKSYLDERRDACLLAGIVSDRILYDPGIGFGKTAAHNIELLRNVSTLRDSGRPVLIGHSRKRFLYKLLGRDVDERLAGTVGVSIAMAQRSADVIRVHDVAAVRDALKAWQAISPDFPAQ